MPAAFQFWSTLSNCTRSENLQKMLIFYLAPVLQKIKPSELVILKKNRFNENWLPEKDGFLAELGLTCEELHVSENVVYLLFYDEKMLCASLTCKSCQNILKCNNYQTTECLQSLLHQLKNKMKLTLFPHEIGLFLGYPAHDVAAFIKFGGKNYCLCRHWKVYHDIKNAGRKFVQIDEARENAACILGKNIPIKKMIAFIKKYKTKQAVY